MGNEFIHGFNDAEAMFERLQDKMKPLQAVTKIQKSHIENIFSGFTFEKEEYKKGFRHFLIRVVQSELSPIEAGTPIQDAVNQLQFASGYEMEGYKVAEHIFNEKTQDELVDLQTIHSYLVSHARDVILGTPREHRNLVEIGYRRFVNELAELLEMQDDLLLTAHIIAIKDKRQYLEACLNVNS